MNKRILCLVLLAALLVACNPAGGEGSGTDQVTAEQVNQSDPQANRARQVRTIQAEEGSLNTTRTASVRVDPFQESQVAADVSGKVTTILQREGTQVERGDAVIQLDTAQLQLQADNARSSVQTARVNLASAQNSNEESITQARNALQNAETNLELAQQEYEQGQQLFNSGGISQTQLTQFRSQLEGAQTNYQQAQNSLAQLERAPSENLALQRLQLEQARTSLAQAERSLADATIKAPFAGEVAEMLVEEGEFTQAGSPTFRLVSTEEQLARFSVAPEDAAELVERGEVQIYYRGLNYAAWIIRTSNVASSTGLVNVTAKLYEAQTRIPTGASAQLRYDVNLGTGVTVPANALRTRSGQTFVLVIEEGAAKRQRVQVVGESGDRAVVSGLDAGQAVIYPLPSDLRAGTPVQSVSSTQTHENISQTSNEVADAQVGRVQEGTQ